MKKKGRENPFSGFRNEWTIRPVTRVVPVKKGKGSYRRQKNRRGSWDMDTGSAYFLRGRDFS